MKYVRTKDGKILSNCKKSTPFTFKGIWEHNIEIIFEITNIYKQADDIKDLCDFFVVYEIGGGSVGEYRTYRDLELAKYSMDNKVSVLYGAILVLGAHGEPILKPVAKMNEEKELKLL